MRPLCRAFLLPALTAVVAVCAAVPARAERRELIVWGSWRRRGLEAAYKVFEREHSEWKVVTSSGATAGRMDPQKLMCAIAGGSPPDTLIQDRFSVGEWAVRDAFLPLKDYIDRSLQEERWSQEAAAALKGGKPKSAVAALDRLIGSLDPLGRTRRLELAGELRAAARRLTASQQAPTGRARERAARGHAQNELRSRIEQLLALCQGIHPERYYRACWEEACFGEGDERLPYAIPNTTDDRALFVNMDVLDSCKRTPQRPDGIPVDPRTGKARPPRNWEELADYAVKLSKWERRNADGSYDKSSPLTRLGFAPNYGNSWLYIYGWLNGGKFMSDDGRTCTLDDPRIVQALEFMVRVYDSLGGVEKVDAFQSTFQGGEFDPFLTGKVAMKIDGDWFQNHIADYAPTLNFKVVPAPAPDGRKPITWSGGFSWVIPRGAENKRMAFELIRFLMTDRIWKLQHRVQARYSASQGRSYVPQMAPLPHINAWTSKNLVANNPNLPHRIAEHFEMLTDLMKVSKYRPVTPVGQLLWDQHVDAYENAVRHIYKPEEALKRGRETVQAELDLIYKRKAYPRMNWAWPIGIVLLLLVGGAVFVFLRCGRLRLLREMARPQCRAGYAFASPWMLGLVALMAGPIVISIVYSFCRYDVLHPAEFVGLDNYRRMFQHDALFRKSLANTAYMMLGIPLGMAAGLGVAMLLNTKVKGMQVYRTVFYLPAIVPVVASSILWIWVLNPQNGLINSLLKMFGVMNPPNWLASPDLGPGGWQLGAKSAIILMMLWGAGAGMIIWLAGLKGIPQHLYEAAEIDGAGRWGKFRNVTLPMLSPYIFFNLIMGIIGTLQIFAQAYIMTPEGGPGKSTLFYAYYLFNNAFRYFKMGYASALAWILFLIILTLTLIQLKLAPRWVHYEAD